MISVFANRVLEGGAPGAKSGCVAAVAAGLAALMASACTGPPMSADDRIFDEALSKALERKQPVNLAQLERGAWIGVCAVGEGRARDMFARGARARPGERAFDSVIDAGSKVFPGPGVGALAFAYPDGVEVRPLSDLAVNMGEPINRCVNRADATLTWSSAWGWHFLGHVSES